MKLFITVLRMAIGWHFLYEGISKIVVRDWTSFSYLANSTGPFSGFYHWLTSSDVLLRAVDFINRTTIPVMGFKVLAAGAITPEDGIRYAFENGADFVCLGMFDFQVIKDINICLDVLANLSNRKREFYG